MKIKSIFAFLLAVTLAAGLCGCAGGRGETVYAQSVKALGDMGAVGVRDRFAGVAVSGRTMEIKKDPSLTVEEIRVEEGQLVAAGDVLFTYNNDSAALRVDEIKAEIESLKNKIEADNAEITELAKERDSAASADKLGYTLEIQGLQAEIKETQYTIGVKEKALAAQEAAAGDTLVKSEIAGRVTAVNSADEQSEDGAEKPFITIVEVGNLRIKGFINELNRGALNEGDVVTIRSRTDETRTWKGTVQSIDWENAAVDRQDNMGYDDTADEMTTASRYPFYVTVDASEGLIIGQHVYIEPGETGAEGTFALTLPAAFLNDADTDPWVWATGGSDKLEKRKVTLGDYDEEADAYPVLEGLREDDYVAFPDPTLQAGMKAEKVDGVVPMDDDSFAEDVADDAD